MLICICRSNALDTAFSHSKLMNIVYKNKNKMYDLQLDSDNDTLSTTTTMLNMNNNSVPKKNTTRNAFNSNNEVVVKSKKKIINRNSTDFSSFYGQKTSFKNSLKIAKRRNIFDNFLLCGECTMENSSNNRKISGIMNDPLELSRCIYICIYINIYIYLCINLFI
jgi:hypothetical protein